MEIALKIASVIVGEKKMKKEKEEILKRKELTVKEKLGLVKLLEKKHQIKAYRWLLKTCHVVLSVIEFFSIGAVMLGLCFFGAESTNLGLNLLLGILMIGLGFLGYIMYCHVSEDAYLYRLKLKEAKKWVKENRKSY